jgi:hypothetical protein
MKELINIISELKAPKDQFNAAGKYRYRTQEGILEAVKPLLKKYECLLFLSDEIKELQVPYVYHEERNSGNGRYTIDYNGSRVYIESTATIVNSAGESISVKGIAREDVAKYGMAPSQLTGAASSYARKYALNGLFCIDDTKDDDETNTHGKEHPVQQPTTTPQPAPTAIYQWAISALNACTTAAETIQVCKTWENRVGDQVDAFKNECRAMYNKLSKAS